MCIHSVLQLLDLPVTLIEITVHGHRTLPMTLTGLVRKALLVLVTCLVITLLAVSVFTMKYNIDPSAMQVAEAR